MAQKNIQHKRKGVTMAMPDRLEYLVESLKSKMKVLAKSKKPYMKMEKSSSVKGDIQSRKARELIDKALRVADRPGKRSVS